MWSCYVVLSRHPGEGRDPDFHQSDGGKGGNDVVEAMRKASRIVNYCLTTIGQTVAAGR
ncbi:hypothetical protein [Budvicia diplopodorum]|uniref:hypothetical protein n=1 Tax=Budvicia diplopodorum TaxID=1119056 RepID=UPI00135A6084|nr:hypothetical protein [Budvicia diplopodorum]